MGRYHTGVGCSAQSNYDQKPDYADAHIVGAIFAHGIYRLMGTKNLRDTTSQGELLMRWLAKLASRLQEGLPRGRGQLLKLALVQYLELVGQPDAGNPIRVRLNDQQCDIVAEVFGGLWPEDGASGASDAGHELVCPSRTL